MLSRIIRPTGKQLLGVTAIAGVVALLILITATAALAGVWLPGQQATEVAAPHEMDQMYRPSFRTIPAMTLPAPPKPKPKPVAAPAPSAPSGDIWGRLRACESSDGRTSPNGLYHNWFQFDVGTWHSVGGQGHPKDASYEEALKRAKMLQASRGWAPWPSCSRQLGLR